MSISSDLKSQESSTSSSTSSSEPPSTKPSKSLQKGLKKVEKKKVTELSKAIQRQADKGKIDTTIPMMSGITFPSTTCAFGKKFSGKSTFLKNYLKQYNKVFDEIILISQSAKSTHEYDNIFEGQDLKMRILSSISDEELEFYLDEKKAKGRKSPHSLLMFDDIVGMRGFHMKGDMFKEIVTSARQYNVSLLLASQQFRIIPAYMRSNCEFALFLNINKNEIGKVYDEFGPNVTKKLFINRYQEIVKKIGFGLMHRIIDQQWFLLHIEKHG